MKNIYKLKFASYFSFTPPKPCSFCNEPLQSNIDLFSIINDLNSLIPQFSNFITQFNDVVNTTGINVVTDSIGNMSIDVPKEISDEEAHKISTRINVIDRLIKTRAEEINDLFVKGSQIEKDLKSKDPNYVPQLVDKIKEYKKLNDSYRH